MNLFYFWESKRQAKIEAEKEERRVLLEPLGYLDKFEKERYDKFVELFLDDNFCPDTQDCLCHLCDDYNCLVCWVRYLNSEDGLKTLKALIAERDINGRKKA